MEVVNGEVWSSRCSYIESMSVPTYKCFMFVSCVHPVAVINAAFCMTCSLLMLVENARGDHMEEAFSRASLMTALWVGMGVVFCFPHAVAGSVFIICGGLCTYTEILSM